MTFFIFIFPSRLLNFPILGFIDKVSIFSAFCKKLFCYLQKKEMSKKITKDYYP